uniref:Secreted protein n=1 Tax=Lepeophtheirus salmonis TaxID=72036 RepID=A0A0K2UVC8_LEPSM
MRVLNLVQIFLFSLIKMASINIKSVKCEVVHCYSYNNSSISNLTLSKEHDHLKESPRLAFRFTLNRMKPIKTQ